MGRGAVRQILEAAAVLPQRVLERRPQHVPPGRIGAHQGPLQSEANDNLHVAAVGT